MPTGEVHFAIRASWRAWLAKHHATTQVVWLVFYKKHTGKKNISYDAAVEEALCVGWVDSAKREATRRKRLAEALALLEKGKKLGLK